MSYRSMTMTEMYLIQARKNLIDARQNIEHAQRHDPDPEVTDEKLYPALLNNVDLLMLYCSGRILAGQPDKEREATS